MENAQIVVHINMECQLYKKINRDGSTQKGGFKLEKWFPLQGERAQSLEVFNVRMLGFKNKIEMRKRRQNSNRPINLPQGNKYIKGIYNFQ